MLWLRSTAFPESLCVGVLAEDSFRLSSDWAVSDEPGGFTHGHATVHGMAALHSAMERFAALARTRPNRVAEAFATATDGLPRATEAQRLVVQRVGQSMFRQALLEYWGGRCCITGLDVPELLRASHIKPWAACTSDAERLDVHNGVLLAPHLDALFEGGWVMVEPDGRVRVSDGLSPRARTQLRLPDAMAVLGLTTAHQVFLETHRRTVFRR